MNKIKNVLITGSSDGIGKAIALKFLENGYNVFITGTSVEKLENLIKKYNFKGYFASDLTINSNYLNLIKEANKKLENIDILINNAGQYVCKKIEETTDEDISKLLKLNVEIPYKLCREVIPQMKKNKFGRIINIGSVSGVIGEGYATLYSLTKSSFFGFSKALALEIASVNITVNTINPGWVDNKLLEQDTTFTKEQILDTIPQRRFVEPSEIADLCLYLASDKAKTITGQSINICAGISMG